MQTFMCDHTVNIQIYKIGELPKSQMVAKQFLTNTLQKIVEGFVHVFCLDDINVMVVNARANEIGKELNKFASEIAQKPITGNAVLVRRKDIE